MNSQEEQFLKKVKDYKLIELLGEGTYCQVYRAFSSQINQEVAVREISKEFAPNISLEHIERGFEMRMESKDTRFGEHVVKLLDLFQTRDNIYIVTELCDMNLMQFQWANGNEINSKDRIRIFRDILKAIEQLCDLDFGTFHIKMENILLGKDGEWKLDIWGVNFPTLYLPYSINS